MKFITRAQVNFRINFLLFILLCSLLSPAYNIEAAKSKKTEAPYVVVTASSGFFAVFSCVLSTLDHYDRGEFSGIKIDLNKGVYLDPERGPNWWEYYFKPIDRHKKNKKGPKYTLTLPDELYYTGQGFHIPRERAFKLIKKYIHIKSRIKKEVNSFVKKHFKGHFVIGVHHRGTDKIQEVPLVSYATTVQALNEVIAQLPKSESKKLRIYVATDEQDFLTYMLSLYPSLIIHGDFVRSSDSTPLHGGSHHYINNYEKGKEALIECLLLSKCKILIYPQSSLSLASTKFNPYLTAIPLR